MSDHNESAGPEISFSSKRGAGGEVKNRIDELFLKKNRNILSIYCTAGYPNLQSTVEVITALQNPGADMIELGMPYSDPLADGPVIQESSTIALKNGMTIPLLFEQLKEIRNDITVPLVLMGYLNPVLQFGVERFCEQAATAGVDGIIIPDLPMYEFEKEYRPFFEKHGLRFIFLVTPETNEERIRKIDELSSGFIYAVSSSATTGNNKPVQDQESYFKKIQLMDLRNPVLVGFGIRDKSTFQSACRYTHGAIIGSAYINVLKNTADISGTTKEFLNAILG